MGIADLKLRIADWRARWLASSPALRAPRSALRTSPSAFRARRPAFTLIELTIVMLIIAIMAAIALSALAGATEVGRQQRTRAIINKLDQLIMEKYESYRTRPVLMKTDFNRLNTPKLIARGRLYALRELMRMELPDRIADLCNTSEISDLDSGDGELNTINVGPPSFQYLQSAPSVSLSYKRRARSAMAGTPGTPAWTRTHQGAECLYLIISSMRDGDKSALDYFNPDEIGDVDEDGQKEFLDGWGRPIQFVRWPAGFLQDGTAVGVTSNAVTLQTADFTVAPDSFDLLRADRRWEMPSVAVKPYALTPLIFSAGPDRLYDINVAQDHVYQDSAKNPHGIVNDPYRGFTTPLPGEVADADSDGDNSGDNITNHYQETP